MARKIVGTGWGRRAEFGAGATARARLDAKHTDYTREDVDPYWEPPNRQTVTHRAAVSRFSDEYARDLGFYDQSDMRGGW